MSSDDWCTPEWLCALLGRFDLDPCSNPASHVAADVALPCGGLDIEWTGSVFCNPPYSDPAPWCARLRDHTGPWCALVKCDPSTRWWADLMAGCDDWAPFARRIKFERPGAKFATPPFASALVWGGGWRPSSELQAHLWMSRRAA